MNEKEFYKKLSDTPPIPDDILGNITKKRYINIKILVASLLLFLSLFVVVSNNIKQQYIKVGISEIATVTVYEDNFNYNLLDDL